MAVAFDAFTDDGVSGTGNLSWTHTPVGTPRAILVSIAQYVTGADEVSGVTYGGVAMSRVAVNLKATGQPGGGYVYILGSNIPTGAQTVSVTVSASTATRRGTSMSLTGAADTETVDSDTTINSDSLENPSVTLSHAGRTCFDAIVFMSGQNDVSLISPLANWTARLEVDAGPRTLGFYTFDTISASDATAGWTQTAQDAVMVALAVSEVVAAAGNPWYAYAQQ